MHRAEQRPQKGVQEAIIKAIVVQLLSILTSPMAGSLELAARLCADDKT